MLVSVIIPTYNEEKVILECIFSLKNQSIKDFEIIIVDDGSTDNTLEILSQINYSNLKILKQNHQGPAMARNLGAKHAKGKILVFVDADMTFDKEFLKNLINPIIDGKTNGTFSKDEYVSNWDSIWARCWNINEGWEPKKRHPKNYPDTQKVFRAILKSEFDRVGGFSKGGYTDDYTLSEKLGYKAVAADNAIFYPKDKKFDRKGAIFYHKNPDSLGEIFNHAKWVSKREYKLGLLGTIFALLRASIPISIIIAFLKLFKITNFQFVIFKLAYDLGIFVGILEMLITGKTAK